MKLLTNNRAALGGFAAFSVFRLQRSIGLRSIHVAPACCAPAAGAGAKVPSWVMLDRRDCRRSDSLAADGKAVAECRTSAGRRLRVSFGSGGLSPPPESSFLSYNCAGGTAPDDEDGVDDALQLIAAHGDSVLLQMRRRPPRYASRSSWMATTFDHFVYRAAAAAARPPSLSLLPPRNIPTWREGERMAGAGIRDPHCRPLLDEDTVVLRRDDGGGDGGELLVVQLELMPGYSEERYGTADLCVLRHGRSSSVWEKRRSVPILHDEEDELPGPLAPPAMAIPVGDRFLCWVRYHRGFILCDMADEASPKLRYIRLPGLPSDSDLDYYTEELPPLSDSQGMGAAGAAAVRLVAVDPRCCCGGLGRCSCPRSRFAFTVTSWTLTLPSMEKTTMAWVKDGVMDCEELWELPGYEGIPREHLREPIVSLDNPDVVCFKVGSKWEGKPWMIQVDTRKKELLAAVQCTINNPWRTNYYLPAKLQR